MSVAGIILGGRINTISFSACTMFFIWPYFFPLAYTLWGVLLKYNPPSKIVAYGFMNPVFGVILSALFLKEEVNVLFCILSLSLISAGILSINLFGEKNFLKRRKNNCVYSCFVQVLGLKEKI